MTPSISLLVINNDKLIEIYGDLTFTQAFAKANEVLNTATKGIAEVISQHLLVNIDLNDARRVLERSGTAVMGQATASGENRAIEAVKGALDSPLLNDNNIKGAKQVLLKIVTGSGEAEIRMMELADIKQKIQEAAGCEVNIIEGIGIDPDLQGEVCVTVIATGFNVKIIRDDVTIDLDDEINIDDVLNQEGDKKEKEDVLLTEDKGQQSIFDTLTEIKPEQEPELKVIEDNNSDSELKGIKNEDAELEVNIEQTDIQEEVEGFTEVEMNVESDKVVINLDDETTLPEELIPTLKKEEAPMAEMESDANLINKMEEIPVNHEVLSIKSREREDRLKNISIKLRTPSGLTSLEDEPAYKRDNVDLEETPHSSESEVSKYTLSEGEDTKTELKQNNSFLHDNVD